MKQTQTFHGIDADDLPMFGQLIVHRVCRHVEEIDGGCIVSDPMNSEFYWGNFFHLDHPENWSLEHLESVHKKHLFYINKRFVFSYNDNLELHRTSNGLRKKFEAAGYHFEAHACLIAKVENIIPHQCRFITFRQIETEEDWKQALGNQLLCRKMYDGKNEYVIKRIQAARRATEAGNGQWMGAFDGKKLVCDLGVFWDGQFCRFQAIGTHPEYRGQGIVRSLLTETVKEVSAKRSDPYFIILTGLGAGPQRVYEKCGFVAVGTHIGFVKKWE